MKRALSDRYDRRNALGPAPASRSRKRLLAQIGRGLIRPDAYDADAGAGAFYANCGFLEKGRVSYKGDPLVYFELLLA